MRSVPPSSPARLMTETQVKKYATADPFDGEESELTCRKVTIRKAKKDYLCYGFSGKMDHNIDAGDYYRHERTRVDGSFWGEYRICLKCMDAFLEGKF